MKTKNNSIRQKINLKKSNNKDWKPRMEIRLSKYNKI